MDFHADAASINLRSSDCITLDNYLELLAICVTADDLPRFHTIQVQEERQVYSALSQHLARVTLLIRRMAHDEHSPVILRA